MIEDIINRIRNELVSTFDEVVAWFEVEENLLDYKPKKIRWSIRQILEHISLTNRFLLILIRKATAKSLAKAKTTDFSYILDSYNFSYTALHQIGEYNSFAWNRPDHMEPTGELDNKTIKIRLGDQVNECLKCLDDLKNGEGVLYNTMMSVNNLGKIDVYHYIYFLVQHAKRHITQMEKVKGEFKSVKQ